MGRRALCLPLIRLQRFRLLPDRRAAERGAGRALRAGSLIVEGKKIWLESRQASAVLC